MNIVNRIAKNTGILYAKMAITVFISLYTTRLILKALGAEDFGIFNVVGGAIAMLGFLSAAMASATQRFMSYAEGEGKPEKQKSIFNISLVLHFLIALIVGVMLLVAGYFFFNGILNIPPNRIYAARMTYFFMIVSTIFTIMAVPYDAVLNAHEDMLYYSIVGIIESVLKLTVAFIVVETKADKLIVFGALMASISLIIMVIMRIYCHQKYIECNFAPKKYFDKKLMKEMTGFAGWNLLATSSSMTSQYGLSIVLNYYWGTRLNTAQGIANQISGQLMVFSNTMMKAINPVMVKNQGGGNRNAMLNTSILGAKYSYLLLVVFAIPFMIETPYILHIWLGKVPEWAILFTRLQLLRSLIEQFWVMIGGGISATGDIKFYTIVKSILSYLPIILTYILFNFGYPPYTLYVTWILMGSILSGMLTVYFAKHKCGLLYSDFKNFVLIPGLGVTIVMIILGICPTIFMSADFVRLLVVGTTTTLAFVISLYLVFLTKQEKEWIRYFFIYIKNKIQLT